MNKSLLFFIITICIAPVIKGMEKNHVSPKVSLEIPTLKELCMQKAIRLFNDNPDKQSFTMLPTDLATEIVQRCNYVELMYNKKRKAEIAGLLPELESSAKRSAISAKIKQIDNRKTAISTIDQNQTVEDWCQTHYGKDEIHIIRRFNMADSTFKCFKLLSPKTKKSALVLATEMHRIRHNRQPQHVQFYKDNLAQLEKLSPIKKNPFIKQLIKAAKKEIPITKKASRRLFQ